jgi:hypothetical protein
LALHRLFYLNFTILIHYLFFLMLVAKYLLLLVFCVSACYVLAQETGGESEEHHIDLQSASGSNDVSDTAVDAELLAEKTEENSADEPAPVVDEAAVEEEAPKRRSRFAPSQEEAATVPTRPVAQEHTDATVPTRPLPEVHPEVLNSLKDNVKGDGAYVEITEDQWMKEVFEHPGPVAMLVYDSDGCKHSSKALTEFSHAARVLKGMCSSRVTLMCLVLSCSRCASCFVDTIKCVAIEGMLAHAIRGRYVIQGFPHMRLYGVNRHHAIPYQNGHNNETYVEVLTNFANGVREEEARNAAALKAEHSAHIEL